MSNQFFTVASSLPRMSTSFKVEHPPISRAQLEKRLNLLSKEDARLLFDLERLTWSSWFMPHMPIARVETLYRDILAKDLSFMQKIADWYLDLRSIFAAIRMRQNKKPEHPETDLISNRAMQLVKHWDEPDFGLKAVYPWLPKIAASMEKNETVVVEEFVLSHIWQYLSSREQGHYFDLEYLAIYLLRWNVVNYWTKLNKSKAVALIDELCFSLLDGRSIKESGNGKE